VPFGPVGGASPESSPLKKGVKETKKPIPREEIYKRFKIYFKVAEIH